MNRLKLLRYERGVELTEVAEAVGVNRQTLGRLEAGSTVQPNASTAKALADYYGLTVAELLGVDQLPKEQAA